MDTRRDGLRHVRRTAGDLQRDHRRLEQLDPSECAVALRVDGVATREGVDLATEGLAQDVIVRTILVHWTFVRSAGDGRLCTFGQRSAPSG